MDRARKMQKRTEVRREGSRVKGCNRFGGGGERGTRAEERRERSVKRTRTRKGAKREREREHKRTHSEPEADDQLERHQQRHKAVVRPATPKVPFVAAPPVLEHLARLVYDRVDDTPKDDVPRQDPQDEKDGKGPVRGLVPARVLEQLGELFTRGEGGGVVVGVASVWPRFSEPNFRGGRTLASPQTGGGSTRSKRRRNERGTNAQGG